MDYAVYQKDAKARRVLGEDEMNRLRCWNRLHYLHDEGKMASEQEEEEEGLLPPNTPVT